MAFEYIAIGYQETTEHQECVWMQNRTNEVNKIHIYSIHIFPIISFYW